MKMILGAFALAIASPAAAQTAPAGHDAHAKHSPAEHAASQQAGHAGHTAGDAKHDGKHQAGHDGCMEKGPDGKMVCKMKAKGKQSDAPKPAHGDHGGH